jgi:hypothetical protein
MSKYTETDAAQDSGSSTSSVAHAWHDARDHARDEGSLSQKGSFSRSSDSGQRAQGFWSSIFGSSK